MSDVRYDLGYGASRPAAPAAEKRCKRCGETALVLHQDPRGSHPERTLCGACQGLANAQRIGR